MCLGVQVDGSDNLRFDIAGDFEVFVGGKYLVHAGGTLEHVSGGASKWHSGGNMDAAAPRIDLNTNSPSSPTQPNEIEFRVDGTSGSVEESRPDEREYNPFKDMLDY